MTGEYLFTWMRSQRLPALVTTSPAGTPSTSAGGLGLPTTSTVIGEDSVNDSLRSAGRFALGWWFFPDHYLGVETGSMFVESRAALFTASSDGSTILARPFFDQATGTAQSNLISFPGTSSGSVFVKASSGNFYEAHVDFSEEFCRTDCWRHTLLLGYRFFRYDEALLIQQSIFPTGSSFAPGTEVDSTDNFQTKNEFHGVDVGLRSEFCWRKLSAEGVARISVGNMGSTVNVLGSQVATVPGAAPVVQTGGLYALASNIGSHTDDKWTIVPEVGATLCWRPTCHLEFSVGYSLLWLNEVARAPDQIDFVLNRNLIPPATQTPTNTDHPNNFNLSRSDLWLQSISFGAAIRY
jgi:hypothetical protein